MGIATIPVTRFVRASIVVAMLLALNGAEGSAFAQDEPSPTVILVQEAGYGRVLTDPDGWTLYRWDGDQDGVSNCTDGCAAIWAPYVIDGDPVAPDDLPGSLGLLDRGDEGWQVTFNNRPLYYFSRDLEPGDTNGDGSMGFGARWSVIAFGAPIIGENPPVTQPNPVPQPPSPPAPTARPLPTATLRPTVAIPPTATPVPTATPLPAPAGPGSYSGGGPQFGNWGPGMAPPDQEGLGPSASSGAQGAPNSAAAAPYAAPAPGVAPAPYPYPYGGCQYDLRGSWRNDGRQTAGGFQAYSNAVYVRQYRIWIQATQDDGTGYYGQCIGNRLQLDVYRGNQFVGRQSGSVSGSPWWNYGDLYPAQPYAAPAPAFCAPPVCDPVPPYGTSLQAYFTWNTWYGTGTETWYKR